jgi:hypothetical protein
LNREQTICNLLPAHAGQTQPFAKIGDLVELSFLNYFYVKPKISVFKIPQHIQATGTLAVSVKRQTNQQYDNEIFAA